MELRNKSEYLKELSAISKQRYVEKVTLAGLNTNPYCLQDGEWKKNPERLTSLTWSDVMIYMVATPSPYTKESVKAKPSVV